MQISRSKDGNTIFICHPTVGVVVDKLTPLNQMRARYDHLHFVHNRNYRLATSEQTRIFYATLRNRAEARLQRWA